MIGNVGGARPAYHDRTSASASNIYNVNGVAPHGQTVRWTYTVPTGKKAFIEMLFAAVIRQSAGAPVGLVEAFFQVDTGGGFSVVLEALLITNVVGDAVRLNPSSFGLLTAGEAIRGVSSDTSTDGTVWYQIAEKHSEFDA